MTTLDLGTRGSRLAQAQAQAVVDLLARERPDLEVATHVVETRGDQDPSRRLQEFGGIGAFTRELDLQVLDGRLDGAVHSLKDVPTDRPAEYAVPLHLPRGPAGDVLVSEVPLDELPSGSTVGTGSLRRRALLRHLRPDLELAHVRGNVPTRVEKLARGDVDALVLAAAGLARLDLEAPTHPLDERAFPPAPGQGAIAVAARRDSEAHDLLGSLDHEATRVEVSFERRVLNRLGGGCLAPLGVRAVVTGDEVHAWTRLLPVDGSRCLEEEATAPLATWEAEADAMAARLRDAGGAAIVEDARGRGP